MKLSDAIKAKKMRLGGGGRFAKLERKLEKEGKKSPGGLAAYIGRKKYGKQKFQELAAKGRKRAAVQKGNLANDGKNWPR